MVHVERKGGFYWTIGMYVLKMLHDVLGVIFPYRVLSWVRCVGCSGTNKVQVFFLLFLLVVVLFLYLIFRDC